jgi:hypothetical protein
MAMPHDRLTLKKEADMVRLGDMVGLFCREKHSNYDRARFRIEDNGLKKIANDLELDLCPECSDLLRHGLTRLFLCTQDPKPMCKHCLIQCYAPVYKHQIHLVMRHISQELSQMGSGSHPPNR